MKNIFHFILFWCTSSLMAQGSALDGYIREGLAGSEALRQKNFQLEKSVQALQEAKGLFMPNVSFGGTYTLAAGGRKQSLPVGDLVNPVYATLNQLTQSNNFPQISNQEIQFLPNNFYDARFRVTQPLVNAEIWYNRELKQTMIGVQEAEIRAYKRELVKNIKAAYFQYCQSVEALSIYDNGAKLLTEVKRVNESLVKNGAATPGVLMKNEADLNKIAAQKDEAEANSRNAAAYFNFLLNKPLDSPIQVEAPMPIMENAVVDSNSYQKREELAQLGVAEKVQSVVLKMNQAYYMPKVGANLDLGSQAFDFKWGGYVLFGLSVDVPIWSGNRNKSKIKQQELEIATLKSQTLQVEDQLKLQLTMATNSVDGAIKMYNSYSKTLDAARKYYRDALKKYKEGATNYIEVANAQTDLTNAELQQNLAHYGVMVKLTELERAAASYQF